MEDVKQVSTLNSFLDWWFVSFWSLHDLSGVGVGGDHRLAAALVVHVHQLGQVESGSLQNLHFTDVDIMEGVDSLACLLNISGNRIWDKFVDNFLQVSAAHFVLEISKGNLENSSLQTLGGNLGSSSSVNQSLANLTDLEDSWSLDVIPVLSCEWINDLLLDTLLASNLEALVFAYSHV